MSAIITYPSTANRKADSSKITLDKILQADNGGGSGSGGLTFLTEVETANTVWVAKNGSDALGQRERVDKPFLTLTAAKNAAVSGDTIRVESGVYAENNLWKGGVVWDFDPGASVQFTDAGGAGRGLFDDQADPGTTCIVHAPGSLFRHIQFDNGNIRGAFVLTNASSRLYLTARRVEVGDGGFFIRADDVAALAVYDGTCFAEITELVDISVDPTAARCSGIYFQKGYADIEVDYMEIGAYAVYAHEPAGTPTASLYYRGKFWKHRVDTLAIQSLIFVEPNATGTPNLNYFTDGDVDRMETAIAGITVYYVGNNFLTGLWHICSFNVGHEFHYGSDAHITLQKLTNLVSDSLLAAVFQIDNHTGKVVLRIEEIDQLNDQEAVRLQGTGSVMMEGQYIRCANSQGFQVEGAGTYRIKGYRIDTRPTNSAANAPVVLGDSTTGLVLEQCVLLAPALADCVEAAVARTITNYGSVANKAKDANVTVAVQAILVDAAVV